MVVAGATPNMSRMAHDFSKNPMLVYWEMTQACGLACKHCRAEAMPTANPFELNTEESKRFLKQLVGFGNPLPHLILTGGDPLSRKDIYELIDYATGLGLEVSVTPSATPELTNDAISKLKAHGIQSLGLSLDGSCAEKHDAIRAVPGTFDRTIEAARHCGRLGLPIQVNTLVAEETADDLPAIYELLRTSFPVMRWSLFMLISVGRGKALNEVSPEEGEAIMRWVFDLSQHSPFAVKTTEAPSYRRIAIDKMRSSGMANAGNEGNVRLQRISDSRRTRHRLRIESRRDLSLRISAAAQRECPQGFPGRDLSQLGNLPRAAQSRHVPWKVRLLRIQPHLRRIARPGFRLHGRCAGHRSVLPLRTRNGERISGGRRADGNSAAV